MTRAVFTREDADTRRQALIEATAASLAEAGIAGTSVRAICMRAGVSAGLLRHYFDGVDALIAETYRATTATVGEAHAAAVAAAGADPRARLIAYVTASFRPPVADPALLATWLAFWSLVKTDAAIAAIHADTYRGYRGELEGLLSSCGLEQAQCRSAAIALTALVDGLWLELTLDPTTFTAEQASAMAVRWLDSLLEGNSLD
ncbi:transcriptional regulator BetI [Sphingomonas colocasiae]|uniref:Transcriptional regulator BetI n=1 Tax=Sphingomonas colocasiae TaxID=1848973 RepID=A0ABS7PVV2_9SPHN|nr:transcriptional regulator BetI [Sphingomonas colocasiae]MBY8824507.1 transcriptional regulator BetI [Sphingomonas colocasiae]